MEDLIITKEILGVYDKYDGDFGLLDERWASKDDRKKVTLEQSVLLGEYVDKLHLIKLDTISAQMGEAALKRIAEVEKVMDREVIKILRKRILN
jgi:hypothetical protein